MSAVCLASGSLRIGLLLEPTLLQLEACQMDAHALRRMLALSYKYEPVAGEEFEDRVGSAPENSPDHLRNGLWAASQLISAGSSRANKRVLIFTRDEDPAGSGSKAESHRHSPCHTHVNTACLTQCVRVCVTQHAAMLERGSPSLGYDRYIAIWQAGKQPLPASQMLRLSYPISECCEGSASLRGRSPCTKPT